METNSFNPKPKQPQTEATKKESDKSLEKVSPSNTIKFYDMVSLFKDYKNDRS